MYPTDGRQMRASSKFGKNVHEKSVMAILMKRFLKEMCVQYWKLPQDCQKLLKILFSLMITYLLTTTLFFKMLPPLPPGAARIFTVNWQGPYWKIYVPGGSIP